LSNASATCDTDTDGYGNPCDGDFTQDENVLALDFSSHFVPAFKSTIPTPTGTDMSCDGTVLGADFTAYFVPRFKATVPGPSGLSCAGNPGCS
jgi:hypothetical protein